MAGRVVGTRAEGWTPPEEVRIHPAEVYTKARDMTAEECRRWVLSSMRACLTGEAEPGTDGARLLAEAEERRRRRREAGRRSGEARRARRAGKDAATLDAAEPPAATPSPAAPPPEATAPPPQTAASAFQAAPPTTTAPEPTGAPEATPAAPDQPPPPAESQGETILDRFRQDPEGTALTCPAASLPALAEAWEETWTDAPSFFFACREILETLPADRFREILVARIAEGWRGPDGGKALLTRLERARNRWRAFGL